MEVRLRKSNKKDKKYMVTIGKKKIHFGQNGYQDYTTHNDDIRKKSYIARHRKNQIWSKKGYKTAGFWSRWLLWNKKTISESKRYISNKFNIKFI